MKNNHEQEIILAAYATTNNKNISMSTQERIYREWIHSCSETREYPSIVFIFELWGVLKPPLCLFGHSFCCRENKATMAMSGLYYKICTQAYLSLADGDRRVHDLQRPGPAPNVPVVGLEGYQGDRSEEGEPGGEGDAKAEEGSGLASPPTRDVLLLSMARDRETSLIKTDERLWSVE